MATLSEPRRMVLTGLGLLPAGGTGVRSIPLDLLFHEEVDSITNNLADSLIMLCHVLALRGIDQNRLWRADATGIVRSIMNPDVQRAGITQRATTWVRPQHIYALIDRVNAGIYDAAPPPDHVAADGTALHPVVIEEDDGPEPIFGGPHPDPAPIFPGLGPVIGPFGPILGPFGPVLAPDPAPPAPPPPPPAPHLAPPPAPPAPAPAPAPVPREDPNGQWATFLSRVMLFIVLFWAFWLLNSMIFGFLRYYLERFFDVLQYHILALISAAQAIMVYGPQRFMADLRRARPALRALIRDI